MFKEAASAALASFIPILMTTLFAWLGNRSEKSKRNQLIGDAKQRIELINGYVSSQSLVISDIDELEAIKKAATKELAEIKAILDRRLSSIDKSIGKADNYILRYFLLYRMQSSVARVFRLLFFVSLVVATLIAILFATIAFEPKNIQSTGVWISILVAFIFSVPGIMATFVLHWIAKRLESHYTRDVEGPSR